MSDVSAILALPYLQPAQAQKHVTHNEALARLDVAVQLVVEAFGETAPPALPEEGRVHAPGPGATGAWAGQDGRLATWIDGAWQFTEPREGWRAWGRAEAALRAWDGADWVRVDPPGAADFQDLAGLGIGTQSDAVTRLAVAAEATLFGHAGADHRVKVNKAAAADTATLLFQTGWSGRAEIGLAGEDALSVKVSADGSAWAAVLRAEAAPTPRVHLGDVLRLIPSDAPADAAAGDLYFDAASATLRCHDGSQWHDLF